MKACVESGKKVEIWAHFIRLFGFYKILNGLKFEIIFWNITISLPHCTTPALESLSLPWRVLFGLAWKNATPIQPSNQRPCSIWFWHCRYCSSSTLSHHRDLHISQQSWASSKKCWSFTLDACVFRFSDSYWTVQSVDGSFHKFVAKFLVQNVCQIMRALLFGVDYHWKRVDLLVYTNNNFWNVQLDVVQHHDTAAEHHYLQLNCNNKWS